MAAKKLFIFDNTTKRVIGCHHFWDDDWTVADEFKTFDSANQVALVVDRTITEHDSSGNYIQPTSYASSETTLHEYVDPATLP